MPGSRCMPGPRANFDGHDRFRPERPGGGRCRARHHLGNAEPTGEASAGIGAVEMESGFDPAVKAALKGRGYNVVPGTGGFGGYQAIMWDATHRVYWGASEMRKDGEALGY